MTETVNKNLPGADIPNDWYNLAADLPAPPLSAANG